MCNRIPYPVFYPLCLSFILTLISLHSFIIPPFLCALHPPPPPFVSHPACCYCSDRLEALASAHRGGDSIGHAASIDRKPLMEDVIRLRDILAQTQPGEARRIFQAVVWGWLSMLVVLYDIYTMKVALKIARFNIKRGTLNKSCYTDEYLCYLYIIWRASPSTSSYSDSIVFTESFALHFSCFLFLLLPMVYFRKLPF